MASSPTVSTIAENDEFITFSAIFYTLYQTKIQYFFSRKANSFKIDSQECLDRFCRQPYNILLIAGISRRYLRCILFHRLCSVQDGIHRKNPCICKLNNLQGELADPLTRSICLKLILSILSLRTHCYKEVQIGRKRHC